MTDQQFDDSSSTYIEDRKKWFASFRRNIFEGQNFPLEYWAGFMALRIPKVKPTSLGLDKDYLANVRRDLRARGMLHFFRLGTKKGTLVVTGSVPIKRDHARKMMVMGDKKRRVVPLQELPEDQFTVSAWFWRRCLEVYQARFGKSVFGAYCVLAQQDKAKWTTEELMQVWGTSKSVTYRIIDALKTLHRLVKRKTLGCYEFLPEKAYRAAFLARMEALPIKACCAAFEAQTAAAEHRRPGNQAQADSQNAEVFDTGENSQSTGSQRFRLKPFHSTTAENPVELLHLHFSQIKNARVSVPTLTPRRRVYRCDNETYSLLLHPESPFAADMETIISRCKETSLGELKFVLSGLERRLRRSTINTDDLRIIARYLEKDELRQFRLGRLLDLAFWRNVVAVCKKRETEQISRERYFAPEVLDTDPHNAIISFETARRSFGSGTGCISAARNGGTFFAALLVAFGLDAEEELAILRADITNHELISDITGIGATWVLAQQVPELAVKFTGLSWEELCELREKEVARAEFVTSHDENFYSAPYEEICEAA